MNRGLGRQIIAVLVVCFFPVGCHDSSPKDQKQPVVVRVQYPPKKPVFIEGAVTEFRLVTRDGSTKATKEARTDVPVLLGSVDPGRYTLRAAVRPCDGNCGNLDSTAFRCRGSVVVPDVGDARVIVTVHSSHCAVKQQGIDEAAS